MHSILLYTNMLLIISLIYFYLYSNKNPMETALAALLVAVIVTSQYFWRNPIRGTSLHTADAVVAKLCIFSFIIYTLFVKNGWNYTSLLYSILLIYIGLAAWFSNHYSKIRWCSPEHVKSHAFLHYFCFLATFFAFID
jgi:hypothetical protein